MELKNLPDSIPEEILLAERLMYQSKFENALNIIKNYERKKKITSIERLLALILQGRIYCYQENFKIAVEVGNQAYQLSQKLGRTVETIEALLIKTRMVIFGNIDEAFENILEAETLFDSITSLSDSDSTRLEADILLIKSIICRYKDDLNQALELAKQCLKLREILNEKLDLSAIFYQLGEIYLYKSNPKLGLDFATKSLEHQEQLDNQVGIAKSLFLVGIGYYLKGNFDHALKLGKKILAIKETSVLTNLETLALLSTIYKNKGDLNRAIKFRNKAAKLAEKENYIEEVIISSYGIGEIYRMMGELDKANEYFKQSLTLAEKTGFNYGMHAALFYLILISLDFNNLEQAKKYLDQKELLIDQTESEVCINQYLIAKAMVLKKSGRIRNRTEAELLFKQIAEKDIKTPIFSLLSIVNLCELFLEELQFTNNTEVLDELNPLINKLHMVAEKQNAYSWLAETKLLQAKSALLQMNFEEAQRLLTQAQRIAELHGLNLLALKISSEHDNLLEHLNDWDNLKKVNAPMSERIKLASFNGIIDHMQGKRIIEPPKLIPEDPVLLLIIGEGGFPLFSHQFLDEWEFEEGFEEDLISGFLSAFNTFSGEVFSKGLDRAKFGDYILLMESVGNFSICYLFTGQTFHAKQKLSQFTERIENSTSIWKTLNKYYKTNRVLNLKDIPLLQSLIMEIFTPKIK